MRSSILILIVSLVIANPSIATAADFERVGTIAFTWEGLFTGGRLAALGGSDLADGSPAAFLINPSPLSRGNGLELGYDHANYFLENEFNIYSGTAEWNAWRLNVAMQELFADDVVVRTAYNPEGTGETFDYRSRITEMGLSYDLGRGLFDHPSLRWSVGVAWGHYSAEWPGISESAETLNLGSTVGWSLRYEGGRTTVYGAMSWRNLTDATMTFDERDSTLPRPLRLGVTMETAFDWAGHQGDFLKLLLAYTHCRQLGDTFVADSEHTGVEAVFFDILALRWGHSTRVAGDIASWGVGVVLDGRFLGPFTVHADIGEMGYDNLVTVDSEAIWGVRVGYDF